MGKCVYVSYGCYCTLTNKKCPDPYVEECDEIKWDYFMKMAEDYVEEKAENPQQTNM